MEAPKRYDIFPQTTPSTERLMNPNIPGEWRETPPPVLWSPK